MNQLSHYVNTLYIQEEHILEGLLKFMPTSDEVKKFENYKKDNKEISKLSHPDKVILEMMGILRFKERMHCTLFKVTFEEKYNQIEKVKR
jgi:hypothetical protein